jgi:large subunit ribosomal protein L22
VRLVADLIRGKNLSEALGILNLTPNRPAGVLKKLLNSAVSNGEAAKEISDMDRLAIQSIRVDPGPMLKRYIPRARGRATMIRKRSSHISVVLGEK